MTGPGLLLLLCLNQSPIERTVTLPAAAPVRVDVHVPPGRALVARVDQGEIDLVVAISDGTGRLAEFDARERATEIAAFVPATSGRYSIEVQRRTGSTTATTLRLQILTPPEDAAFVALRTAAELQTQAKALFGRGQRDDLLKVVELLRDARRAWSVAGERAMEAAAVSGIGDAFYTMSAFEPARTAYLEALDLARSVSNMRGEAEVLNNLAMVSWPLGDVQPALEWLAAARDRWRALRFPYGEAIAINNRGILLWESGEYGGARQAYREALAMFERLDDRRGLAYALSNMGVLLEALGERPQALQYLSRAIALFRATGDRVAEGRAEVRRSRVHLAHGQTLQAASTAARALTLLSGNADRLAETDAVAQQARVYARLGRTARARFEWRRALEAYQALGSRRSMSDVLHDLGRSHLDDGDADNAAAFLTDALTLRRALGVKPLEAETLFQLGLSEQRRGRIERAQTHFEAAIALVETLRGGVLEKQLRTAYAESKRQYYAAYVGLLLDAHETHPGQGFARLAFAAAERARSRGLTELLQESWSRVSSAVPPDLRAREEALRKSINFWSWQLWQRSGQAGAEAARLEAERTLNGLLVEHDTAIGDIRRADARFGSLLVPETVSVETIQTAMLRPGEALVAFHLGTPRSAVWVVTRDRLDVRWLPSAAAIGEVVHRFSAAVARQAASGGLAARANRLLIDPIADLIEGRRVVVIPDGALHGMPWAALAVVNDRESWLRAVRVSPSAAMLTLLARQVAGRQAPSRVLAAFGDPVFETSDPRVTTTAAARRTGRTRSGFSRLPHSRDEVERILALVPASRRLSALDFDADRATATSAALSDYRIVHFATHAVQDSQRPSLSGIVLSLVDRRGRTADGFLRLHDIYNLRLRADLVVLSACESGIGPAHAGEGVASLARGLFHAGAAGVLSTLWKVDDEATAHLMEAFYRSLLRSGTRDAAAALAEAQAEIRRQPRWSHPYYWAGFILQGVS